LHVGLFHDGCSSSCVSYIAREDDDQGDNQNDDEDGKSKSLVESLAVSGGVIGIHCM
jgi:hypothetical protein